MYIGRFLVVAPMIGGYRVSSRSFPNREATDRGDRITVGPTADAPPTDNPYISYNCVRLTPEGAVLGNGSHVDPVAEKLELGYPARDALASSLLAMDFEKDDYDTPRIAGIIGAAPTGRGGPSGSNEDVAYVGIVRRDALLVEAVSEPTLVATYEKDSPESITLDGTNAATAAQELQDMSFEHAVCSAGVAVDSQGYETAVIN